MNDVRALCKAYVINLLSNKFVFVFNLLLPTIYFLYQNGKYWSRPAVTFNQSTNLVISYFWAYIIMMTILNNVIVAMIAQRENGFYKQLFFIVGSKWKILIANFLVQLVVLNGELIIFNVVVMIVFHNWHISLLVAGMLSATVVSVPVALISSLLFLLKVKIESINILVSILLFGLFALINLPKNGSISQTLSLLNPLTYTVETSFQTLSLFFNHTFDYSMILIWLIVTVVYGLFGWFGTSKLSVHSIIDRV
ncbi:ABC transporter permease [uncultured Leuconostoc sp.]|uniref:ABC transporter permease n=1 Tax=uncultured Leuconostoc sp. TaxID=173262 RepID=UPI0025E8FE82|nr:ABC transporter permease [uncultured Leuconostoc sp.]